MLQKLNQKNKKGNELYQEVYFQDKTGNQSKVYGSVGTLAELATLQQPSVRQEKRHPEVLIKKLHTNRARTRGRLILYQRIVLKNGGVKTIKQIRETASAIVRKTANFTFIMECEKKSKQWEKDMVKFVNR